MDKRVYGLFDNVKEVKYGYEVVKCLRNNKPFIFTFHNSFNLKNNQYNANVLRVNYNTRNRVINSYVHRCYKNNTPPKIICPISVLEKVKASLVREFFDLSVFNIIFLN